MKVTAAVCRVIRQMGDWGNSASDSCEVEFGMVCGDLTDALLEKTSPPAGFFPGLSVVAVSECKDCFISQDKN